ncbi:hypothetical protein FKP32DRAFT_1588437 [Trametes sanguinea]|nr:hypothetical protein FKP32DRAFT_1588437 [Trametes sanguinea]
MATARTLPLPHDIVHMLIDQLGDRKVDLASCSLVCRDWLQPCRSHLFRSLNVYSTHADGDFSAFIEFLASPGGQCIGRSVRRLSLQDGGPDRPRMPLRLLADILCSWLPSLQELEFRRVKFERDDVDPASVGTGSRLTIGKLVFHCDAHWQFEHFSDTLNVLHLFSDISQLEFWEGPLLWSAPADVLKDLRWSGPTKVQSLALVDFPGEWSPIILQAITQSGSLDGALDTLTIGSQGDVDEIEPLLPSLQAVAPCIRRLRLNPIIHNIHISLGFGAFITCRIPPDVCD